MSNIQPRTSNVQVTPALRSVLPKIHSDVGRWMFDLSAVALAKAEALAKEDVRCSRSGMRIWHIDALAVVHVIITQVIVPEFDDRAAPRGGRSSG